MTAPTRSGIGARAAETPDDGACVSVEIGRNSFHLVPVSLIRAGETAQQASQRMMADAFARAWKTAER